MKHKKCCCGLTQYDCGGYLVSFLTQIAIISLILCGVAVFFFFFYAVMPFFAYEPEGELMFGGRMAEKLFGLEELSAENYNLVTEYIVIICYVFTTT